MLEYNITKQDIDFMILWSNYLLTGKLDVEVLDKLAEHGQINAIIQSYCMPNKNNEKLNRLFDLSKRDGAIYDIARMSKYYFENKKDIETFINESSLECQRLAQTDHFFMSTQEIKDFLQNIMAVEQGVREHPYYAGLKTACEKLWQEGKDEENPCVMETAVEFYNTIPYTDNPDLYNCVRVAEKKLTKKHKEDPKDISIVFALGKNLALFSVSDKKRLQGIELLQQISKLPYMSEFLTNKEQQSE